MLAGLLRQAVQPILTEIPRPLAQRGRFLRKVRVDFRVRDYHVKTVENRSELDSVLDLRRDVFHYEFAGKWLSLRSDRDALDATADHLAIFDTKRGELAGAYRLISSQTSRRFYASSEYELDRFLAIPGKKLELSRACIHRKYRNGAVIALLWKGLVEYAKLTGTDWLFGLSSVRSTDPEAIVQLHLGFERQGFVDDVYRIEPVSKYRIPAFRERLAARVYDESAVDRVPPLLRAYLKAGAKICAQPVIDRNFNCADWLTVLEMRRLSEAYERRFVRDSASPAG